MQVVEHSELKRNTLYLVTDTNVTTKYNIQSVKIVKFRGTRLLTVFAEHRRVTHGTNPAYVHSNFKRRELYMLDSGNTKDWFELTFDEFTFHVVSEII